MSGDKSFLPFTPADLWKHGLAICDSDAGQIFEPTWDELPSAKEWPSHIVVALVESVTSDGHSLVRAPGESVTLGYVRDVHRQMAVLYARLPARGVHGMAPEYLAITCKLEWCKRWLESLPGFVVIETYVNAVLGRTDLAEGIDEILVRLARIQSMRCDDLAQVALPDAMAALSDDRQGAPLHLDTANIPGAVNPPCARGRNDARDKFIYERRKEGLENKLIRKAVNETTGWPKLGTDQAVNGAVNRYCKRYNLEKPKYKS